MLLPLALMLSLGAIPRVASCEGERLVLLPFDSMALTRPQARSTEEAVRRALARTSGVCLEPRKDTLERLRARDSKQEACTESTCRASEVKAFGTQWLVHGRVLGLGGERTVSLALMGVDGRETRTTFQVPTLDAGVEESAKKAFIPLWEARHPRQEVKKAGLRPLPMVLVGTGVAALAVGAGFGMAAHSTEKRFSQGTGGCQGDGEDFRRCFSDGLRQGERQSHLANGLLAAGAVLGAGGAVLLIWELP